MRRGVVISLCHDTPQDCAPEWAEILRSIIGLEIERGYNNRAVVGGLDSFRKHWHSEMSSQIADAQDGASLLARNYADLTPEQRAVWARRWLELIGETADSEPKAEETELQASAESAGDFDSLFASAPATEAASGRTLNKPRPAFRSPPAGRSVDDAVDHLRGINAKTSERLKRLDVTSVRDLLYLFPRRHEDYSNVVSISDVVPGQECTLIGSVLESRVISQGPRGRRQDTEAVLGDDTGNVRAIWFGQRYLARTIPAGKRIAISGRAELFRGQPVFESPAVETLEFEQAGIHTGEWCRSIR